MRPLSADTRNYAGAAGRGKVQFCRPSVAVCATAGLDSDSGDYDGGRGRDQQR